MRRIVTDVTNAADRELGFIPDQSTVRFS